MMEDGRWKMEDGCIRSMCMKVPSHVAEVLKSNQCRGVPWARTARVLLTSEMGFRAANQRLLSKQGSVRGYWNIVRQSILNRIRCFLDIIEKALIRYASAKFIKPLKFLPNQNRHLSS